jgi:hypothetical protein
MSRRAWIRCLLISVLGTVLAPLITVTPFLPDEGAHVVDLKAVDPKNMTQAHEQRTVVVPVRRVEGWQRITYWFDHPNGSALLKNTYWPAAIAWFLLFFAATSFISYSATRDRHGA